MQCLWPGRNERVPLFRKVSVRIEEVGEQDGALETSGNVGEWNSSKLYDIVLVNEACHLTQLWMHKSVIAHVVCSRRHDRCSFNLLLNVF